MPADRPATPDPSLRSAERRRLVPYFLAAILIHLTLLVYETPQEASWLPAPMGTVSLTLGQPTPPVLPPNRPVATPPSAAPKAPPTPKKIITAPASNPTQAALPPPLSASADPAPRSTPPTAAPTTTASAPSPTTTAAENAGNPSAAISPPRFDAAYLLNPKPDYPPLSRRLGEEGKVLLKVTVTAQGLAAVVELEQSSGFTRLDEAARRAVARWRFVPAKRGEQPVEASVIVPISFRLEG